MRGGEREGEGGRWRRWEGGLVCVDMGDQL